MKAVPRSCPPPASNVIETLERWLARAKAGELRAVLVAGVVSDAEGEASSYEVACGKWVWRDALLGVIERAKFVCLSDWTGPA